VRDVRSAHGAGDDRATLAAWESPEVRDAVREYVARTLRR
jgi:hypothetical protein